MCKENKGEKMNKIEEIVRKCWACGHYNILSNGRNALYDVHCERCDRIILKKMENTFNFCTPYNIFLMKLMLR